MSILNKILLREAKFFSEMFIEDPLFLELEDVLKYMKEERPYASIVMGVSEKEVKNFLYRLKIALEHIENIYDQASDEESASALWELHDRAEFVVTQYNLANDKFFYPPRFQTRGV